MRRNESNRRNPWLPSLIAALALGGCVGVPDDGCFTEGSTLCDGQCVDTASDPSNCGACGVVCEPAVACVLGTCGAESRSTHVQPESCQDECPAEGERRCAKPTENAVLHCDDFDGDGCLEWGELSPCAGGQTCSQGACEGECTEDCEGTDQAPQECIAPDEDCVSFDDCCDEPDQGYHCCPIFHICVPNFW
jgi:hypothetical protein